MWGRITEPLVAIATWMLPPTSSLARVSIIELRVFNGSKYPFSTIDFLNSSRNVALPLPKARHLSSPNRNISSEVAVATLSINADETLKARKHGSVSVAPNIISSQRAFSSQRSPKLRKLSSSSRRQNCATSATVGRVLPAGITRADRHACSVASVEKATDELPVNPMPRSQSSTLLSRSLALFASVKTERRSLKSLGTRSVSVPLLPVSRLSATTYISP